MASESSKKLRFGRSKSRTGCLTCKARRVKCDENKPHCNRCIVGNRSCKYTTAAGVRNSTSKDLVIINYGTELSQPLFSSRLGNTQECRFLAYYQERTAADLSYPFTMELWSQFILRIALVEPAIRHAVISLGALHETFQSSQANLESVSDFARRQYGSAIQQLLKQPLVNPGTRNGNATGVALVACILFACIECVEGHFRSAIAHIRSGWKIVHELVGENVVATLDPSIPWAQLRSSFKHLETQLFEMQGDFEQSETPPCELHLLGTPALLRIPPIYQALEEAQEDLEEWYGQFGRYLWHLRTSGPDERFKLSNQHVSFISSFHSWSVAFDTFRRKQDAGHMDDKIRQGILILCIWQKTLSVILTFDWDRSETHYDKSMPLFAGIIELAEALSDSQRGNAHAPVFVLCRGIVAPLYITGSRCRDPSIRRRVVSLLKHLNRREGPWESQLSARVVERIMDLEESMARSLMASEWDANSQIEITDASQIPEAARIRSVESSFGPDKSGVVSFGRQRVDSDGLVGAGYDTVFSEETHW